METQVEQNAARLTISLPAKPRELQLWLVDQLTILAEAMGEAVTPQRLQIYATDLSADLSQEQLSLALTRARRECRFFPKISELREFAGGSVEDRFKVETEAAWTWANDYLRKWGTERLPLYQGGGKRVEAPSLPARIEYALRRIGGLRGLNQVTEETRPFVFKAFGEAYRQAPLAELQTPGLQAKFGAKQLLGETKKLTAKVGSLPKSNAEPKIGMVVPINPKRIPEPPTDAQIRDRRANLKQQAAALAKAAEGNKP
jgi:hypothetical protein